MVFLQLLTAARLLAAGCYSKCSKVRHPKTVTLTLNLTLGHNKRGRMHERRMARNIQACDSIPRMLRRRTWELQIIHVIKEVVAKHLSHVGTEYEDWSSRKSGEEPASQDRQGRRRVASYIRRC